MGYIYKIENLINHKIYIGQTTKERPTDRFSQHRYLARHPEQETSISYLHRAMNKYGVDNFLYEIIEETDIPMEREQYWIKKLNTYIGYKNSNGYNATLGGESRKTVFLNKNESDKLVELYKNGVSLREIAKILRKIGNEKINYFLVNVSLFTNIEFTKSVKEKLFDKMKIQDASEDDLKGNSEFWQDKNVPAEQFLKHKELI